ncbi:MAG: hypothetical protein JSW39_14180, partial [Desulfobacterales bacterium]
MNSDSRHNEAAQDRNPEELPLQSRETIFSDHMRIEARSLALHRAVAGKIRENPQLMEKVREKLKDRLRAYSAQGLMPPGALSEWEAILEGGSLNGILQFLVSPGEEARRLRQSSPFAGILSPQQRWKIYAAYRS